jgi:hypothetical protein
MLPVTNRTESEKRKLVTALRAILPPLLKMVDKQRPTNPIRVLATHLLHLKLNQNGKIELRTVEEKMEAYQAVGFARADAVRPHSFICIPISYK